MSDLPVAEAERMAACIDALRAAGVAIEDAPGPVQRKSRDFYWYSPILKRDLAGVCGDFIATRTAKTTCA